MKPPARLTLTGALTPAQALTYLYLPFEVPEGIGQIDVQYSCSDAIAADPGLSGGSTIDIGIFDAGGIGFASGGFRGWSGSARRVFSIGRDSATPGYMPGPIPAGTWHICLGAYKVAAQGCAYRVDIDLIPAAAANQAAFPPRLALDDGKRAVLRADGWYSGELHCHTVNSDGDSTAAEIVALAEAADFDFLAVTDHNTLTQQVDLTRLTTPLLLIPGLEVTTYFGHWNVWGGSTWIDFRVQQPADLERSLAFARAQGCLISCNHPRPYGPDWAFPEVGGFTCVEVWNGPWELLNSASLAFWEVRLKRGERLVAVGGSDHHFSHRPHIARLGFPTLRVYVAPDRAPTARDILDAIRAGHCIITEAPDGPGITLNAGGSMMGDHLLRPADDQIALDLAVTGGAGGTLQLVGSDGILTEADITQDDQRLHLALKLGGSLYVRAQLTDSGQMRTLTNPLYFG
ncbi:MAG: CehA/McbA family metallohydrolase [Anaerolineae bacterium]|nr:CehA/McbA family metallohydrolase [Anaerolineae bacterium]NUQ04405.1 PHP domain-containing protein [Anaerolineae bacterium]